MTQRLATGARRLGTGVGATVFFSLMSLGCAREDLGAEATIRVLNLADEEVRPIDVSTYISRMAEIFGRFPFYLVSWRCSEDIATSQITVASPMELVGNGIYVYAWDQSWEIGVSCDDDDLHKVSSSLNMEKMLFDDGTGTAEIFGSVYYGKKHKECEVDMTLTFNAETGVPTDGEGTICGESVDAYLDELVVPGFTDEHLLSRG